MVLPQMASIINWFLRRQWINERLPSNIIEKIESLANQFDTGCKSLKNPVTYPAIALLSLAIWFFYWLNFYLMVYAFGLNDKVSPSQCLVVFTIGSVGVLVPTPGNVGSFHFLVSQGLTMISGVNKELALAFASLLHAICFIVVTCVPAAICFVIQSYLARQSESTAAVASATQSNGH